MKSLVVGSNELNSGKYSLPVCDTNRLLVGGSYGFGWRQLWFFGLVWFGLVLVNLIGL